MADSFKLLNEFEQQQRYDQRAPSPTGFAAPTAAYMPQRILVGPQSVEPSALGSGTFDVNAPAPVANALARAVPSVNAFRPGAVTAESVADQIRQGNAEFGNAPGWVKDREILMKQYEALLNPRQRAFAPIDASKYTPESIRAFNVSGDQSDLVAIAPKDSIYAAIDPSKYTPASLAAFETSGKRSDLVAIAPKDNIFAAINPSDYTPASVAAFEVSGKRSDLVPRDKPFAPPAPDRLFAPINVSDFTPASVAAFEASGNRADLVAIVKPVAATPDRLFAPINVSDFTPASVAAFEASGNRADLVAIPKTTKTDSTMGKVDIDKFTPASLAKYAKSGDYLDLVALPPKPTGGGGGQGKPPSGYRWDASGENLEKIPGGPADKEEKLKPIPPNINTAIGTNDMSIKRIQEALDLLKKYPNAIGFKNLLPGQALDRADPKGVAVRSAIGDIGSLVIHDRSGAAVTASEMQRLGFIPTPTDRADNAKTKLESMLKWAKAGQQGLSETYSESQGYKPSPALAGKNKAAPANVSNW